MHKGVPFQFIFCCCFLSLGGKKGGGGGYNRNLKSSKNLRMSHIVSVFKLLDAQIVPSLLYAAEISESLATII